jgi:imidazole glycerol-phosphate synthase subunit HisH
MAERLVIIDYGSGNLRSAAKALQRAADDAQLTIDLRVSATADDVQAADRIVLPGVGAFNQCANALRGLPQVWETLSEKVITRATPFLGICIGMQLMSTQGLEHGCHAGLDWIAGDVVPLAPNDRALKIPHMGWNTVDFIGDHTVLKNLPQAAQAYFVHSYEFKASAADMYATTDYGGPVTAIVGRDTMIGTQFHPEKSQGFGLAFLTEFLRWRP